MGQTLRAVELFASGTYRDKSYTVADLEQIARNCRRLGPRSLKLVNPPAVLGHEEDQDFLDRTDLPAAAWVDTDSVRVRKYYEPATKQTEAILVGDLVDVPSPVAHMIRARRYRKVSSEIYDDFHDDFGRRYGKALRRVSFLGGEVPQVKRLADLPMPTNFAETVNGNQVGHLSRVSLRPDRTTPARRDVRAGLTVYTCFSEVRTMDREQMIAAITAAMPALQPATLTAMTDDQLADLAKNLPAPAGATPEGGTVTETMADPGDMTREELVAALTEMGEDPASLEAQTDDDLRGLYQELTAEEDAEGGPTEEFADPATMTREEMIAELTAMGEDPAALEPMSDDELRSLLGANPATPTAVAPATPAPGAIPMSERRRGGSATATKPAAKPKTPAEKFAERTNALVQANYRHHVKTHAATKQADAEQFFEQLVKAGKKFPAEKKIVVSDLMKHDHLRVRHYHERGTKLALTAYEQRKREYSMLPVVMRFGEKVKDADASPEAGEREVNTVRKFAEVQASALKAANQTPESYVETFVKLRTKNPKLTARQYGVPPEYAA